MARPMFRVRLTGDDAEFQLQIVAAGQAVLDRWNTNSRLMGDWLGPLFADPVWEDGAVGFYARDEQQRQLADVRGEAVTAAELTGAFKSEFAELKQCLQRATPPSPSAGAVRDFLLRSLSDPGPEDDCVAFNCQFWKYQDVNGRWRLVWCCGFCPVLRRSDARPTVCANDDCRCLVMRNPTSRPDCPACGKPLAARARPRGARRSIVPVLALLLVAVLAAAAGGYLWLLPNATLVGRVVRAVDQQPIVGAEVAIAGTPLVATTDTSGAFRIEKAPRGLVTVQTRAMGYREQAAQVELANMRERSAHFQLGGAARVAGRVVRRAGENDLPIPAAKIHIKGSSDEPLATDADGQFQLEDLSPGPVPLDVTSEGYQSLQVEAAATADQAEPLRIVLTGDGLLSGRVVFAADSKLPIPAAELVLEGLAASGTRADSNGQFRISGVPPGELQLSVSAPGFEPLAAAAQVGKPPLTLAMKGNATLTGTVIRGDTEKPAAEVEVHVTGTPFKARSDTQGAFRIEGVRSGSIRVTATGSGMGGSVAQTLPPNQETAVQIVLMGDKTITGQVLNALDQQALEGATVTIADTISRTQTNELGRYRLEGVAGSSVALRIEADGFYPGEVTAELNAEQQEIEDVRLRPIASLGGYVVRAHDKKPLAGALVSFSGTEDRAQSDADGKYILPSVPAGPASLTIAATGYQPQTIRPELTAGRQRLETVALEGNSPAAGVTLDAADDKVAVPNATLEISAAGFEKKLSSEANGGFKLGNLPAGLVRIKARAAGFLEASVEKQIAPDDAWIKVPMQRLIELKGVVIVDPTQNPAGNRQPVGKAEIEIRSPTGLHKATSAADGGYSIAGMVAGPVRIIVKAPGYVERMLEEVVDAKRPLLEIPLVPLVKVQGLVVESANPRRAISNATVTIPASSASLRATSSDRGVFQMAVPPGKVTFRVQADGFAETVVERTVSVAEPSVELRMPRGITVRGQVINAINNQPVPGASIALGGPAGSNRATSDDKGEFVLSGVPAGSGSLDVSAGGFESAQVALGTDGSPLRIVLTPDLPPGEVRVILTWGARPLDMDGHLFGPLLGGARFHVYFQGRNVDGAKLDVDAKEGLGPETITMRARPGTYQYFVADAANRGTPDGAKLANSGARVQVYYKETSTKSQVFTLPRNVNGPIWHVLDIQVDEQGKVTLKARDKLSQDLPSR